MDRVRPLTKRYAVARGSALIVAINVGIVGVYGAQMPTFEGIYDALTVVAVIALLAQMLFPSIHMLRFVALFGVWMTLVPRAIWWLTDRPPKFTFAQSLVAASNHLALAFIVAALVVSAELLDKARA